MSKEYIQVNIGGRNYGTLQQFALAVKLIIEEEGQCFVPCEDEPIDLLERLKALGMEAIAEPVYGKNQRYPERTGYVIKSQLWKITKNM